MAKLEIGAAAAALFFANAFAQPVGTKLDHVVIAVHDLEAAKLLYAGLGFSMSAGGRHPTGTENSTARLSDGYLELITPYDASLPDGKEVAEHLKKGDGAIVTGLQIASAEQTARELRAAGMNIDGPTPGTIMMPGVKEPPPAMWWLVRFGGPQFVDPDTPSRPVFLIQYALRPARAPGPTRAAPPRPAHPNSATSLSALLIAVNNLSSAMAGYGMIGKAGAEEIPLPEFGAVGREVVLERGSIFLLRATGASGPTARRLKERGEGILAVRLLATDLDQVRKQIGQRNVATNDQSALVSPENAAGVWLEFQAARP